MGDLTQTSLEALLLLVTGDTELWSIIRVSFSTTLKAILLATPVAFLISFILSIARFPGRWFLISLFNTLLGVPTVIVGLLLYLLLSRSGPFGDLRLLFTEPAMILGQILIALPLLVAMGLAAFEGADRRAWETTRTLGAGPVRAMLTLMYEVRFGLAAAGTAAYGRIISEVGCAMMVGGNILNYTRTIPTAIALETSKGEFAQGIALGMVLLLLALGLNFGVSIMQRRGEIY
ncbi:ABC transporter permease [Motiliproteus sp. MSK22-1]|uniref:ABC transporter permease n=1 Tax=Motiliproteus sp. MSK22-1 TaxID=1897630 RepID=UPI0009757C53|nr:ABC transporter permease [Motiliproteus sp. MSK22-1]OMH29065.1 ABC transporter permease [Motiliproteus sp. MSK22-1]